MSKDKSTSQLKLEAQALLAMPDNKIDTNSIPEILDFNTSERGQFFDAIQSLRAEIDKGMQDMTSGNTLSAECVFAEPENEKSRLQKGIGINA